MSISNYMTANVAQLQQSLGIALLKSAQTVQAAGAQVMLEELMQVQPDVQQAPHPHAGQHIDISL